LLKGARWQKKSERRRLRRRREKSKTQKGQDGGEIHSLCMKQLFCKHGWEKVQVHLGDFAGVPERKRGPLGVKKKVSKRGQGAGEKKLQKIGYTERSKRQVDSEKKWFGGAGEEQPQNEKERRIRTDNIRATGMT